MLAFLDCAHRNREMREIRCRDKHSLESRAHLVEHLAEILELLCLREHSHHFPCVGRTHVHVTDSHDIGHSGLGHFPGILIAPVADSDQGKIDLAACALAFLADLCRSVESAERIHSDGSGTQASRLEKISSVYHDSEVGLVISKKRMTTVTDASPAIAKLDTQI